MDMFKILGIAILGALSALLVKEHKPALALCIGFATAVTIFLALLSQIGHVFDLVSMLSSRLSVDTEYIGIILRMIGIAYLTRFGSALCLDAGQQAIAQKIELAGKVMIVVTSIPILTAVLNLLIGILPA